MTINRKSLSPTFPFVFFDEGETTLDFATDPFSDKSTSSRITMTSSSSSFWAKLLTFCFLPSIPKGSKTSLAAVLISARVIFECDKKTAVAKYRAFALGMNAGSG